MKKTVILIIALCVAGPVSAQPMGQAVGARGQAQELFLRAAEHIEVGHFAEATQLLRESIELFPTGATAFNLGVALRGMGDVLAATEQFRALEAGFYGPLVEAQTAQVSALLAESESEIGTLDIRACGGAGLEVRVNGALRPTVLECERIRVQVNPGVHNVTASSSDAPTVAQRVEVAGGEQQLIRLTLIPRLAPQADASRRWYQRPWVWVVVGAVVTGAAVGAGISATSDPCSGVSANLCL